MGPGQEFLRLTEIQRNPLKQRVNHASQIYFVGMLS
jgi:hypothetical protein